MLFLNGAPLRHDPSPSYLGVRMSSDGRWSLHVSSIATRLRRTLFAMCALVNKLGGNGACTLVMLKLYRSLMQPILDYAAPRPRRVTLRPWSSCSTVRWSERPARGSLRPTAPCAWT